MSNLDFFKKFIPKSTVEIKVNHDVWSYTRVSSKEQFERNSSVERQIEANQEYAEQNGFRITESFGGTYESAKSDFTRKEFKRLIDRVTASRKRPHAILVYKMSRFSRSGGGAIGLVNTLVEQMGVHLIECSTGLSTITERGKAAIYENLFQAYRENLDKKELVTSFLRASLKKGNWCGPCPTGYDHYGPRVKREKFLSLRQRFEVNRDGELLREAWQWKASGLYSDVQILAKLAARGLELYPQTLGKIWKNPFYCSILTHKLLEEPVPGKWPALVSREDFIKVQDILEGNHPGNRPGYTHKKDVDLRPLTRLLKCDHCKRYMVGYCVKKKGLHYYRCGHCSGVSLNAQTTPQAKRKGADELFIDLLDQYRLPAGIEPLVSLQLRKLFYHFNEGLGEAETELKSRMTELNDKVKKLKIRQGLGEIDRETYDLTFAHLNEQIQEISRELNVIIPKISNLDKLVATSLEKLPKLSWVWGSSDLENKRKIQKTLFPEGIFYDAKNHCYLTGSCNQFIFLTGCMTTWWKENKKGNSQVELENSLSVPRRGIEFHPRGLKNFVTLIFNFLRLIFLKELRFLVTVLVTVLVTEFRRGRYENLEARKRYFEEMVQFSDLGWAFPFGRKWELHRRRPGDDQVFYE